MSLSKKLFSLMFLLIIELLGWVSPSYAVEAQLIGSEGDFVVYEIKNKQEVRVKIKRTACLFKKKLKEKGVLSYHLMCPIYNSGWINLLVFKKEDYNTLSSLKVTHKENPYRMIDDFYVNCSYIDLGKDRVGFDKHWCAVKGLSEE